MVDAICWKAAQMNLSYGKFSMRLRPGDADKILKEYLQLCRQRREEEEQRLQKQGKGETKK